MWLRRHSGRGKQKRKEEIDVDDAVKQGGYKRTQKKGLEYDDFCERCNSDEWDQPASRAPYDDNKQFL